MARGWCSTHVQWTKFVWFNLCLQDLNFLSVFLGYQYHCILITKEDRKKIFWCCSRNIPRELGQYHSCWWPGSLCHQVISSYGINYVGWMECFFSMRKDFNYLCHLNIKKWQKMWIHSQQATGLDAWASRVKCPARFVSHLHDICIYMSCL